MTSLELLYHFGLVYENYEFYTLNMKESDNNYEMSGGSLAKAKFTLESTLILYNRQVYDVLDLIGDVGGLLEGLKYIVFFVMSLLNMFSINSLTIFLVSKVYRV